MSCVWVRAKIQGLKVSLQILRLTTRNGDLVERPSGRTRFPALIKLLQQGKRG